MSLPAIISKFGTTAKAFAGNGAIFAKKYAPELMIGTGIAGFGATIFATVKATNKTNDIVQEREATLKTIEDMRECCDADQYSYAAYQRDLKTANRAAKRGIVRAWLPVGTLGAASVISVLGGYRILNGRYVATAAAYKMLESGFERYRGNVVERFGKDTDWELLNDIKAEELAEARKEQERNREIDADNKHKKFGKKKKSTAYAGVYNRIFDDYSLRWQRYWNGQQVLHYLQIKENELNDKLMLTGSVMLNDLYDALGFERTAEGCVVGWLRSAHNRVDVQNRNVIRIVSNLPENEVRKILATERNDEIRVPIRPEPDGLIYNLIDKANRPTDEGLDRIERRKLDFYD